MTTYLFIDGGYLRANFRSCMSRCYSEEVECSISATTYALRQVRSDFEFPQKVFYYDCVDERKDDKESGDQHSRRVQAQEDLINSLREKPGWHVREGRLAGSRKQNRGQKRVDVLLAVEMLSHAFNHNMEQAILIAGDDDFTPLVEELLRHGTYVQVWSDRRSGSLHLMHTADTGRRMSYRFYWHLASTSFRKEHPLPEEVGSYDRMNGERIVEDGLCKGDQKVEILEYGGFFYFCIPGPQGPLPQVRARELRVLHEYIEDEFSNRSLIPKEWKARIPSPDPRR
jgi:uncharacterized LabA/DUF88 family protein